MGVVINVEDVSIRYITGDIKSIGFKEYVLKKLRGDYHIEEFWADKNITFELNNGDMLGILGTNGAGKSTLLKAISGIMKPTKGHLKVKGRIAALLELTSGFDGELTVRENTFLRGAMMGYSREFMVSRYDEIIEFAELTEFQDRPYKQLSSGMKSRLAFAIACLVNPDILILDEVLSVGDGAFKKKSSDRMKEILEGGVTGILVSHQVEQVRNICNKILWLDHGQQITFGDDVEMLCSAYEYSMFTKEVPHNEEEIKEMAEKWYNHKEYLKKEKDKSILKKVSSRLKRDKDGSFKESLIKVIETNDK